MYNILVALLVVVSIALIALILIQHGKGADAGAAFGSGASGTVFGARGSSSFLSRATGWLAAAFFVITLLLAYLSTHRNVTGNSVIDRLRGATASTAQTTPAKPAKPASVSAAPSAASSAAKVIVPPAAVHTGAPSSAASAAKPAAKK